MNHPSVVKPPSLIASVRSRTLSFFPATVWILCLFACHFFGAFSARAQINVFPLPFDAYAQPQSIILGPDGAYWYTVLAGAVGCIDTNGNITVPYSANGPWDITVGPDGNLWYTELYTDTLARISPGTNGSFTNGVLTRFPCHPGVNTNSEPLGIAAGPDGNLWFTEFLGNMIGKMSTNGQMLAEYGKTNFQPRAQIFSIIPGPGGVLWFADSTYGKIGTITTNGVINEIALPYPTCQPYDLIVGADQALWFTEYNYNRIGRLTTNGNYSDFVLPSVGPSTYNYSQDPYYLTIGGDGNIWFSEWVGGNVSRLVPSTGVITEFPVPYASPMGIASGPDKNIWFTDFTADSIEEFLLPTLNITITNSQFVLTWPVGATNYTLQGNTNLTSTNWINLTNPAPVATSNLFIYTNTVTNIDFFRLFLTTIP